MWGFRALWRSPSSEGPPSVSRQLVKLIVTQGFISSDSDTAQLQSGGLGPAFDEIFTARLQESWGFLLRRGALVSGVGINFLRRVLYLHRCCLNLSHCVQIAN